MIVDDKPAHFAEMHGDVIQAEFKIAASAKAFMILSDGLYANKIRAIIRELSTNAVDSHIEAKKHHTPFDVHLPSMLAPYFSVRDYGTGLNHNEVVNMYTTYFDSTKTKSNDFVGALGLGSKSPFAYTDNFSIVAIKDGTKNIYTAFINDHQVPSLALMSTTDTDEPAGLEIKFAVKSEDFRAFDKEAKFVYLFLDYRPNITSSKPFSFVSFRPERLDVITESTAIFDDNSITRAPFSISQFSDVIAVMGGIPYPVTMSALSVSNSRTNMILHFDIGELDFKPDREGLSYTPKTISALEKKITEVKSVFYQKLADEVSAITCAWDQARVFGEWNDKSPLYAETVTAYLTNHPSPLINSLGATRYRYFTVGVDVPVADFEPHNIHVTMYQPTRKSFAGIQLSEVKGQSHSNLNPSVTIGSTAYRREFPICIAVDSSVRFLKKIRHYVNNNNIADSIIYVLKPIDPSKPMDLDWFNKVTYNVPNTMFTSAMYDPGNATSTGRKNAAGGMSICVSATRFTHNGDMTWETKKPIDQYDKNDTYYYTNLSGFESLDFASDAKTVCYRMANSTVPLLVNIAQKGIVGIRRQDADFVKDKKNWVNIKQVIHDELQKVANMPIGAFATTAGLEQYWRKNKSPIRDIAWLFSCDQFVQHIPGASPLKGVIEQLLSPSSIDSVQVNRLARSTGLKELDIDLDKVYTQIDSVLKKYEMLLYLEEPGYTRKPHVIDAALTYVKQIDSHKGD